MKLKVNMISILLVLTALLGGESFFVYKKVLEKKKEKEAAKPDPDADYVADDENEEFITDEEDYEPV